MYRAVFFNGQPPALRNAVAFALSALVCWWLGALVFRRAQPEFADVV
jgi:ABC-type polysaccharide/polyol phosphate export permease